MAVCSTCGNSSGLPCGCVETSLTTNCMHNVDYACSPLANQCVEAYCMECVQPCSKEDKWAITTTAGIIFEVGKNESLTQIFQKFLLSQTTDVNTFNELLIPLFYVTNVTSTSITFVWNYTGTTDISGFQIQYKEYSAAVYGLAGQVANPAANSMIITTANIPLTSGYTYVFQINTLVAGVVTDAIQAVDVQVTIP
jgi:hypothetical protein